MTTISMVLLTRSTTIVGGDDHLHTKSLPFMGMGSSVLIVLGEPRLALHLQAPRSPLPGQYYVYVVGLISTRGHSTICACKSVVSQLRRW